MLMELAPLASDLASFGAAGLMGALWLWERRLSRNREQQLDAAHCRLLEQRDALAVVTDLVARNTVALTTLQETQHQLVHLLNQWRPRADEPVARQLP